MLFRENHILGQKVSALGFGGASLSGEGGGYGFGAFSEVQAEALIKDAWELGINVFDTAPIYGFGLSEERLGRYLPSEALVVSKAGVDWHENRRVNMSNDPAIIQKMLDQSLKRLKRDCIDIYMIHWPDVRVDIERSLEVLIQAKAQGKIKHLGLCNTTPSDLSRAQNLTSIEVLQSELNLFNQSAFTQLDPHWQQTYSMAWGTFDKGILSARVHADRKFDASDARSWAPWWNKKEVLEKIIKTKKLEKILTDYALTLPAFCLQYNLIYFNVTTTLVGFKKHEDIVEATSHLQGSIMRERIEEVMTRWRN